MEPYAIVDLHCDTLTRWKKAGDENLDTLEDPQQVLSLSALPESVKWAQFYAIYVPDPLRGPEAADFYEISRRSFVRQMEKFSDRIAPCETAAHMEAAWEAGKTAAFLTVENGSVLLGDLSRVGLLRRHGVRCMTLTWNMENEIASGHDSDHGFSPLGREAVGEMEREGILVDVSHLNDRGFEELMAFVKKPFVASHSNARSICSHRRNLTDDMIREMVKRNCLVGLNYCKSFLAEGGVETGPEQILAHIQHFIKLGGEKILALGSDFDGAPLPDYLSSPTKVARLYDYLLAQGLPRSLADGIFFENARRFFAENL